MVSRSLGDRSSWWLTIPNRAFRPESPSLSMTISPRPAISSGLPFNSETGFPIFLLTFSSGATPSLERFLTASLSLTQTEKLKFRNTTTNVVVIKIVFVVPERTAVVSAEWLAAPAKLLQKSHRILYIQKWFFTWVFFLFFTEWLMLIFKRRSGLQSPRTEMEILLKSIKRALLHVPWWVPNCYGVLLYKINTKFFASMKLHFGGFLLTSNERCTLYKTDSLQPMTIHHKSWKCKQAAPIMLQKITREFYHDHQ